MTFRSCVIIVTEGLVYPSIKNYIGWLPCVRNHRDVFSFELGHGKSEKRQDGEDAAGTNEVLKAYFSSNSFSRWDCSAYNRESSRCYIVCNYISRANKKILKTLCKLNVRQKKIK